MKYSSAMLAEFALYQIDAAAAVIEDRERGAGQARFLAVVKDNNIGGDTFVLGDNDPKLLAEDVKHKIDKLREWGGSPSLVFAWDRAEDQEIRGSVETRVQIGA